MGVYLTMSMPRVILLVVLPSLVSLQGPPDMGPPDMTNCCQVKYSSTADVYRYYNFTPGIAEQYGCLDDCLYMKEGTMEKYCFGPGTLQISCEDEEPLAMTGYLTVKEDGVEFKQKNEDMPDYLKISVPAHNSYPEAVVFYEKESSMRVSCTQGRDTAAEGPVDIAPDRPVFRSTIRLASPQEYEEALEEADELPVCIRWPNTHHITIRVDVEVQIQTQEEIQKA